jgi:hypothetical protein
MVALLMLIFAVGEGLAFNPRVGIWISSDELAKVPMAGKAWEQLKQWADRTWGDKGVVTLFSGSHNDDMEVYAGALVYARTGEQEYRTKVHQALAAIIGTEDNTDYGCCGKSLGIARNTLGFVVAADLIDLKNMDSALNAKFRSFLIKIRDLRPHGLAAVHEQRPNNFGTHAGASRMAVDLYLGDTADLERTVTVFRGWLGERSQYAGFDYGSLFWQCDPEKPVGINPKGCKKDGHSIDGVLPDDQRRGGSFTWPPFQENYVWEALQGTTVALELLRRAGYTATEWSDQAVLRAYQWLHSINNYPADGDDSWQPHVMNFLYDTNFPAPIPASPGKNMGFTDWTHAQRSAGSDGNTPQLLAPVNLRFVHSEE